MKEKKARVEDALHATRAAVEEGVVPGGGIAYLRCLKSLEKVDCPEEEKIGVQIVAKALESPIRTIVDNTGHESSVVVEKVRNASGSIGFNAVTEKVEDLVKAGVIDPTK
jgi:chaperonin GroEL